MKKKFAIAVMTAIAAMAMSAVLASAAGAALFHAESAPVKVTGTQLATSNFTTNAGKASCEKASFVGESTEKTTETLTITPTYSKCTFLGVLEVPIKFNSCDYIFNANGSVAIGGGTACDSNPITFEAASCKISVGAKSNTKLTKIKYTNEGTGTSRDVKVTPEVTGITYTQSALCPGGAGTFTNGTYSGGETTVKGENPTSLKAIGIWVE